MAVTYRSKDQEYMAKLKKTVFQGMKGMEMEDKRSAWKMVQRKVFMDDLHKVAIDKLSAEEPVYMGTGNLSPSLVVLTTKSLEFSKEAKELVETIVKAAKIEQVYYTGKYKCSKILKSQLAAYGEVLDLEMKVVKPQAILVFGPVAEAQPSHEVIELFGVPAIITHALSDFMNEPDDTKRQEIKNQIWSDVKQIRKVL